jgi:RNA polymerase sigma-70 factor (ECF subfamily)
MGPSGKESEIRRAELAAAVTRAASGDQQALRFVYDATSAKLFGVVLRILKDRSEAEDVLQERPGTQQSEPQQFSPLGVMAGSV